MSNLYSEMINLSQLSKTLRFELQPIGKTKEYFEKYVLENDERKANAYPLVKKYCDEVHKKFIDECLEKIDRISFEEKLEEYLIAVNDKDLDNKKLEKIKTGLRKIVSETFKNQKTPTEILKEYLKNHKKDNDELTEKIKEFDGFFTYFEGYKNVRENIYKNEEKHTAIAYRLIDENLPTFKNNIKLYAKFKEVCPDKVQKIKDELNIDTDELFADIKQYSKCQAQKDIEKYNLVIGGKSFENGQKIQGINEYINLYNQQNKDKPKLIKFKALYKQILSDTSSNSFVLDVIENDKQVVEAVNSIYAGFKEIFEKEEFVNAFKNIIDFDFEKIYINYDSINQLFKNDESSKIRELVKQKFDKDHSDKLKISNKSYKKGSAEYEDKKDELLNDKVISLKFIEENAVEKGKIAEYFSSKISANIEKINTAYKEYSEISVLEYSETDKILQNDKNAVEKIKNLLDSLSELQKFIKTVIPKVDVEADLNFYNLLSYESLTEIIPVYNKVRNYMTKKPYSEEKFKLNFDCPTLLDGWDLNKEESNLCYLFEKDGFYYLGIMNKGYNKIFREIKQDESENYKKIECKLLPGPNKMLPKVFFSKSRIEEFAPSNDLLEKYEKGLHKKEANNLEFCHELIDFFKQSLEKHEDWKKFNFEFSETSKYRDISQFYREVSEQGYKITFNNISAKYVDELVEQGKLYLFKIYNKDFSPNSKGTPNLHTMYWKALFDEENLKDVVYKLNGQAEVFYRKKSITSNIVVHKANEPIGNKNPLNEKKTSTFEYDIIKDRRYTLDKFMFHVPITLNFKAKGITKFNDYANKQIRLTEDMHIIGIDRGERHLLYVSVIDMQGNIKEQFSLNEIVSEYKNKIHKVDYHELLDRKETERDKERKSWGTIENIKELKEGYMSQVVHILVELMMKYNGIIVLENLNGRFKEKRSKVEKSVYQKFEKKLANKLEYIVDKNITDKNAKGGLLKAYQLATSSLDGAKQNGFIFYIPAWKTSKIDPTTGFVNLFYIKNMSIEKTKEFFNKFKVIRYNEAENLFEFNFDYSDFTDKSYGIRNNWTVCSNGERIRTFRNPQENNHWVSEPINLIEKFKGLFAEYSIDLSDIKNGIQLQTNRKFFDELIYLFKLILQMRNSKTGSTDSKDDYIISPVKNAKGVFYDSRNAGENLPKDADANGAYNIARKGLMLINRIKETTDEKLKIDYSISNADWLNYVQEKDV